MGNTSSGKGHQAPEAHPISPHQERLEQLYQKLCLDNVLNASLFNEHFMAPHDTITTNMFETYFIDLVNNSAVETKGVFVDRCLHIIKNTDNPYQNQNNFLLDLIANNSSEIKKDDLNKLIHNYFAFGKNQASIEDDVCEKMDFVATDKIVLSISKSMLNNKDTIERSEIVEWIQMNCPKLSSGLHSWLEYKLTGNLNKARFDMLPQPSECFDMNVLLTPSCLWYLCCTLPSCYTYMENKFKTEDDSSDKKDEDVKFTWNLLYNSNQHGLSLNRFKHKVMDYKSPTVTLFEFTSGLILMLALDDKWKDSPEKYGSHYTQLVELYPSISTIESNPKMVYLKETGRSVPTGLLIGSETKPKVKISTDLNNAELFYCKMLDEQVERMEVWGCGGVEALKSQADVKRWETREVEKRKKVKLPGQWDTDKSLLEMGGVRVNHSERGDM